MDIAELQREVAQDEEGATVPIHDKRGEPYLAADGSPLTITVCGPDAKRVLAAVDAQTRRILKQRRAEPTPEEIRQRRIETAAAAVIDWHGWEADGRPLPCTPENARAVLSAPHVLAQVEAAVNAHASFFAKG